MSGIAERANGSHDERSVSLMGSGEHAEFGALGS